MFKYPSLWGTFLIWTTTKFMSICKTKKSKAVIEPQTGVCGVLRIQESWITGRPGQRDPGLKTGKDASEDKMLEDRPIVEKHTGPQARHPAPSAAAAISNSVQVYKRENNCARADGWPAARTRNNSFLPTLCLQELAWSLSLRPCINLKKWPRVEFIF